MSEITQLERDLLTHLVTGRETHGDGRKMSWGAWMSECVESLRGMGCVTQEMDAESGIVGYFATDKGRALIEGPFQ